MENILEDFNYELKTIEFPFKEMFLNNELHRNTLFAEFERLEPKPKLHLYWSEFISTEKWEAAHGNQNHDGHSHYEKAGDGNYKKDCSGNLITIYKDEFAKLEAQSRDIYNEFNTLLIEKAIDKKYYGRFVNDTETVNTLCEISNTLEAFNKYIFTPASIDTFEGYATAAAFKIISLLDKIKPQGFKTELLKSLVNSSENIHITLAYLNNSELEQKELKGKYEVLKTFADKIFNEELIKKEVLIDSNGLTDNYEVALRHWFLEYFKIEQMIFGQQIVDKYGAKRVEIYLNEIRNYFNKNKELNYKRRGLFKQLMKVKNSLSAYPDIQLAIDLHISKIE